MNNSSLGTPEQLRDPNYMPPLAQAIPLGIQHVLAMFVSNVTPAIIIGFAAGFGFGSPDSNTLVYLIQMSMLFAGIATLFQTIGMGPVGARLPIVQGTSFAFLPVMLPAMAGAGVAGLSGLMTGVIVGGIFHFILGFFIKRFRFALPPLVTGLIVLMIGLLLIKVGIQYAAGGVPAMGKPEFGSLQNWFVAGVVIVVTLSVKFFTRGLMAVSAVLIGLIVGYIVAAMLGMVSWAGIGYAEWFAAPSPFKWGFEWNWAIIIGMCLMAIVSAIETVGDTSGITKGGAGREATDDEIQGATFADGLGTALAGVFGGLPNTSFSQNVGLISMTGVMSRHVVTVGAIFLIICGFIPKIGAIIRTIPIEVLGGGIIIMFGMVASAGVRMLADVNWTRRNMVIFATALSIGLGLQMVPDALQHVGSTWKILLTSGLLPAAFIAILLNLFLPEDMEEDGGSETQISGLGNVGDGSLSGSTTTAALSAGGAAIATGVAAKAVAPEAKAVAKPKAKTATKPKVKPKAKPAARKTVAKSKAAARPAAMAKAVVKPKAVAKSKTAAKGARKTATKAATATGFVDDIQLIDGIGPKTAKALIADGTTKLSQVARMSNANLTKLAAKVGAAGQHESQEWKLQAREMMAGQPPRAKVDRDRLAKLQKKK